MRLPEPLPCLLRRLSVQWCERPRQKEKKGLHAKLLEDLQARGGRRGSRAAGVQAGQSGCSRSAWCTRHLLPLRALANSYPPPLPTPPRACAQDLRSKVYASLEATPDKGTQFTAAVRHLLQVNT